MTLALLAYAVMAYCVGVVVAADFYRHRDGLSLASVAWRVVASAVLWPLVAAVAIAGAVARGRR
jgi:cell shape-determining protein MreD